MKRKLQERDEKLSFWERVEPQLSLNALLVTEFIWALFEALFYFLHK